MFQSVVKHLISYRNERLHLFRETRHLHPLNCKHLLYGSNTFTHEDNITIVEAVHIRYIKGRAVTKL